MVLVLLHKKIIYHDNDIMIPPEITKMYDILTAMLGSSKLELDDTLQLQFSCPRCRERDGEQEKNKYHLEVNLAKGFYNCWKCSSIDDSMHGSIYKLIRKYGNPSLLKDYKDAVYAFRESSLYRIKFDKTDFKLDHEDMIDEGLDFPQGYTPFKKGIHDNTLAFKYLQERGIDWPIIEDFHIGFTTYQEDRKSLSNRIILPSFDACGDMNYWTGRDFTGNKKRQRYFNPIVERKDIIFNEDKVEWNADITLVEGPFDSIVVPNSIPLLGKNLTEAYKLYQSLYWKANANINIMLDNDAIETAKKLYRLLDNGRLKGKIKFVYIPSDDNDLDPSKIFQLWGRKGIVTCLKGAAQLSEKELLIQ